MGWRAAGRTVPGMTTTDAGDTTSPSTHNNGKDSTAARHAALSEVLDIVKTSTRGSDGGAGCELEYEAGRPASSTATPSCTAPVSARTEES